MHGLIAVLKRCKPYYFSIISNDHYVATSPTLVCVNNHEDSKTQYNSSSSTKPSPRNKDVEASFPTAI